MYINLHTHLPTQNDIEIYNIDIRQPEIEKYPGYYSLGIHPWWIEQIDVDEMLAFIEVQMTDQNFLAIGEIGLDKLADTNFDLQVKVFKKQAILAIKYAKPLIIHAVKTHFDIRQILNKMKFGQPVIFHGFNQNAHIAAGLNQPGNYFSLGTALLNENSNAADFLKNADLTTIFFENDDKETDIKHIYHAASELLNVAINELCKLIENNFKTIFLHERL